MQQRARFSQQLFCRLDITERLHDISYWQDSENLWFTLPIATVLLLISVAGIILFSLLYYRSYNNKKRLKNIGEIA
jgi:formate-dependent nitrite reductase membrane component NrfD